MNFKNNFQEIFKKFIKRNVIKSLIYATLISCFCLFIISFFFWFFSVKQFWIALIIFGVIEIALFGIFYKIFYPTDKSISRELDSFGLEQRIITMNDYQNDDSLMARIQRENATQKLKKLDSKLIKLVLPTIVVVLLCVFFTLSATFVTVSALAADGKIKTGQEVIGEVIPEVINQYEITYEVEGEGEILGDLFQIVQEGESTTEVEVLAMDGWAFVGWDDGIEEIIRQEIDVHQNMTITAIFQELSEEEQDGDGNGEGEPGEPGEEEREGEPNSEGSEGEGEGEQSPSDEPGGGEGGKYIPNNQVIDGNTYYGDSTFDAAYQTAMDSVQSDNNMGSDQKSIINDYYSTIEK